MTNFFFDTEFIEDGVRVIPLSIGIVADDGSEYYAEWWRSDAEMYLANDWVKDNVFPHLRWRNGDTSARKDRLQIREEIQKFVGYKPLFWAWYATYDWMVMCQMFGNMTDLPRHWPMFPMDLRAIIEWEGGQKRWAMPKQEGTAHNALDDAKHLRAMYDHLVAMLRASRTG
jgi:hypothetical protein